MKRILWAAFVALLPVASLAQDTGTSSYSVGPLVPPDGNDISTMVCGGDPLNCTHSAGGVDTQFTMIEDTDTIDVSTLSCVPGKGGTTVCTHAAGGQSVSFEIPVDTDTQDPDTDVSGLTAALAATTLEVCVEEDGVQNCDTVNLSLLNTDSNVSGVGLDYIAATGELTVMVEENGVVLSDSVQISKTTPLVLVDQTISATFGLAAQDIHNNGTVVALTDIDLDTGWSRAANVVTFAGAPAHVEGFVTINAPSGGTANYWARPKMRVSRGGSVIAVLDDLVMQQNGSYDGDFTLSGVFFDKAPGANPAYTFEWFDKDNRTATPIPATYSQIALSAVNKITVVQAQ